MFTGKTHANVLKILEYLYDQDSIEKSIESLYEKFDATNSLCVSNPIRDKEINICGGGRIHSYSVRVYIVQNFNRDDIVLNNLDSSSGKTLEKINSIKMFMDKNVYTGSRYTKELTNDVTKISNYLYKQSEIILNHKNMLKNIDSYATRDYSTSFINDPYSIPAGFYYINNELWRVRYNKSARKNEFHVLTKAGDKMKYLKMPDNVCKIFYEHKKVDENKIIDLARQTHHCGICGKPIETQESIERGIGPVCFSKMKEIETEYKSSVIDDGIQESIETQASFMLRYDKALGGIGHFYMEDDIL